MALEMRTSLGDFCGTVVLVVAMITATLVFLNGFLPLKKTIPGYATADDFPGDPSGSRWTLAPKYNRLVVVLVDALRRDFVYGDGDSGSHAMPFVRKLISQRRVLKIGAAAHPPTVTMPRVKAITSGDIPGFIDVVLNLNTKALLADNLISQLKLAGKRIIFYGDETWLALFPDHFMRFEGTTSFFVSDYTEVDSNVTRNVNRELKRDDWDVLILHYLGLDHIGHLEGPLSKLVHPKLQEMDAVFSMIYSAVVEQDLAKDTQTLFLLCGDHGMSNIGSHGGASAAEIQTPFLLTASDFEGMPSNTLERYQIDIVPTLAILMGVPIPRSSLGVLIPEALAVLPARQQLSAAYQNLQQLKAVLLANSPKSEGSWLAEAEHATGAHLTWLSQASDSNTLANRVLARYQAVAMKLQTLGASTLVHYDVTAMLYSSIMFFLVLVAAMRHTARKSSVSFGIDAVSVVSCIVAGTALQLACTNSQWTSGLICESGMVAKLFYAVLLGTTGAAAVTSITLAIAGRDPASSARLDSRQGQALERPGSRQTLLCALGLGTALRSLSFLSSSFVEEEHQTWYYLSASALLLLLLQRCAAVRAAAAAAVPARDGGAGGRQTGASTGGGSSVSPSLFLRLLTAEWRLVAALALSRLIRSWNRTGNKWMHLPDVGDWLRGHDMGPVLLLLVTGSLAGIGWWATSEADFAGSLPFLAGLLIVLIASVTESPQPSVEGGLLLSSSQKVVVVWMGFALAASCLLLPLLRGAVAKAVRSVRRGVQGCSDAATAAPGLAGADVHRFLVHARQAWLLLVLLLHKIHNVPLVLAAVVQERLLAGYLADERAAVITGEAAACWALLYAWLGQAGYFAQGNSNGIATIDVGAGYRGSTDYNPVLVGSLMMCITFSSQAFWLLSLVMLLLRLHLTAAGRDGKDGTALPLERFCSSLNIVSRLCLVERCFTMATYSALIVHERYHLFIWSVFAPKLLYESVFTVLGVMLSLALSIGSAFVLPYLAHRAAGLRRRI